MAGEALLDHGPAVGDQLPQAAGETLGHRLHRGALELAGAVGPVDAQATAGDPGEDVEAMGAEGLRAAGRARRLGGAGERRLPLQRLIELAQVVEADLGLRCGAELCGHRGVPAQPAQQAVAETALGQRAQVLLDCAQGRAGIAVRRHGQAHREQAGQPTDSPGEVHAGEDLLAAVPFEVDDQRPARAGQGERESGEQRVVDLRTVRRRDLLEERAGLLGGERDGRAAPRGLGVGALRMIERQPRRSAGDLTPPPGQLRLERQRASMPGEPLRPGLERGRLGR